MGRAGRVCKRFLPSAPRPFSHFWRSPHFSRGQNIENPVSSVFLCFSTSKKRLIRRPQKQAFTIFTSITPKHPERRSIGGKLNAEQSSRTPSSLHFARSSAFSVFDILCWFYWLLWFLWVTSVLKRIFSALKQQQQKKKRVTHFTSYETKYMYTVGITRLLRTKNTWNRKMDKIR